MHYHSHGIAIKQNVIAIISTVKAKHNFLICSIYNLQ